MADYADTSLEQWLAWTVSRGAPDPNQAAQDHPLIEYLDQLETRLAAAEAAITALEEA